MLFASLESLSTQRKHIGMREATVRWGPLGVRVMKLWSIPGRRA